MKWHSPKSILFTLSSSSSDERHRSHEIHQDAAYAPDRGKRYFLQVMMGAASADLPAIQLVGGAMLAMGYHGERLGACTDCRRFWAKYRANEISQRDIEDIEGNLPTTGGSCAVMGTASTMAAARLLTAGPSEVETMEDETTTTEQVRVVRR